MPISGEGILNGIRQNQYPALGGEVSRQDQTLDRTRVHRQTKPNTQQGKAPPGPEQQSGSACATLAVTIKLWRINGTLSIYPSSPDSFLLF